jgi:transcriptional regulator with XRE-family HTH domain
MARKTPPPFPELLDAAGLDAAKVAAASGVSFSQVDRYTRGTGGKPRVPTAAALARALRSVVPAGPEAERIACVRESIRLQAQLVRAS